MKLLGSTGSVLQRLLRSPGSALALLFLLAITLAAIFADLLPLNPYAQKLVNALKRAIGGQLVRHRRGGPRYPGARGVRGRGPRCSLPPGQWRSRR
jgi:hypothetical protein